MKNLARIISLRHALAGIVSILATAFLFYNARMVDEAAHDRVVFRLSKLQELDARLSKLVVELRSGIVHNYDGLVTTLGAMKSHELALLRGRDAIGDYGDAELTRAMAGFSEQLARRAEMIEAFKTRNALLRNSMLYLPAAVKRLSADGDTPRVLDHKAEVLLHELLQLRILAEPDDYRQATRLADEVDREAVAHPRTTTGEVTLHARNVIAHSMAVGELVDKITSQEQTQSAVRLADAYNQAFGRNLERANTYRRLLLVLALLVLGVAAVLFQRLRVSAVRLAQTAKAQEFELAERKKAEERLAYMGQYDGLTGLPNRSLFRDRLVQAMERAKRTGGMAALMFIDLDHFKEINDTLGYATGDSVLQAAARLLQDALREVDTVARLGGDKFAILLENIASPAEAQAVAEKVRRAFSVPLMTLERDTFTTASIGITMYPHDVDNVDGLLQAADVAMYHAKQQGRNRHEFYKPELNAQAAAQLQMDGLLRRALERHELSLHYQPKVDVRSGCITGMEALLRWKSPELGFVSPVQFIPLAEKSGLIVPIGEWVMRTACAQAVAWREQGFGDLVMSVNLSPRQFREQNLLETVAAVLGNTGLPPRLFELEITESMTMEHPERANATLQQLKRLGVQLSMDDFGTGYSSLAYLKRFPVNKLKIDRSFVCDIATDADDAAIVAAIVAMAHGLHVTVVAEGVETREQLEFLARHGCEEFQGYYFSKPVPAAEFTGLLCNALARQARKPRLAVV